MKHKKTKRTNLEVWLMPNAGVYTEEFFLREMEFFHRANPDINVKVEVHPWTTSWRHIIDALKKRKGPDILQIGSSWVSTLADLGFLVNLAKYSAQFKKSDFFRFSLNSGIYKKSIYALPWFIDPQLIFYRKDIFKTAGVKETDLGNWRSFENALKIIKKSGYSPLGVAGREDWVLVHEVAPWLWAGGEKFLNPRGTRARFNNSQSLKALHYFFKLVNKYGDRSAIDSFTGDVQNDFFYSGKYAIAFSGIWAVSAYINRAREGDVARNIRFTILPRGPSGRYVFAAGSHIGINQFSKHPDRAWKLIKFLLSFNSQSRFFQFGSNIPSLKTAYPPSFIKNNWEKRKAGEALKYCRQLPLQPLWGTVELILMKYLSRIFQCIVEGKYNYQILKKEMDEAAREVNFTLSL